MKPRIKILQSIVSCIVLVQSLPLSPQSTLELPTVEESDLENVVTVLSEQPSIQ
jgi:hypothetical protein